MGSLEREAQLSGANALGAAGLAADAQAAEDADTAKLILRMQGGDDRAFDTLYERYLSRIYGYMKVALGDAYEAEDAAHEVFIKVLEALPTYEVRATPFRVWLFKIVRNYTINYLIKSSRVEVEDPATINRRRERGEVIADFGGAAAPPPEVELLRRLSNHELLRLVERLPVAQKQVVVLRFVLDFGIAEVAGVMGRSPNAVSLLQQRAFRVLRERLIAMGRHPDPEADDEQPGTETAGTRMPMRMRFTEATVTRSRRLALVYSY